MLVLSVSLHNRAVLAHTERIHGLVDRLFNLLPVAAPLDEFVDAEQSAG